MAQIKARKGRREDQSPSGYTRLFGVEELGNLLSKIHGASISAGNELEGLIYERCTKVNDLSRAITFSVSSFICSFNARTKKEVFDGLKHKFSVDEVLTGKELCDLFG